MHDIENFCCLERDSLVFALDAIFKLSDMWVTYTSLRNKRLRNPVSGKHPIILSLVMTKTKTKTKPRLEGSCWNLLPGVQI